jgi:hypothetical protein
MIFNIIVSTLLLVVGSLVIYSIAQIVGIKDWKTNYESEHAEVLKDMKRWFEEIKRTSTLEADNLEANKNLTVKGKAEIGALNVKKQALFVDRENIYGIIRFNEYKVRKILELLEKMIKENKIPQEININREVLEKEFIEQHSKENYPELYKKWNEI